MGNYYIIVYCITSNTFCSFKTPPSCQISGFELFQTFQYYFENLSDIPAILAVYMPHLHWFPHFRYFETSLLGKVLVPLSDRPSGLSFGFAPRHS